MNAIIAGFLAKIPELLINTVNIVQLKEAVKDGVEFIQYLLRRETELTQACEDFRNEKRKVEVERDKLKIENEELKKENAILKAGK
jgi:FtsZ-binding cell division protein ZapB